jgi:hypothetical protein
MYIKTTFIDSDTYVMYHVSFSQVSHESLKLSHDIERLKKSHSQRMRCEFGEVDCTE